MRPSFDQAYGPRVRSRLYGWSQRSGVNAAFTVFPKWGERCASIQVGRLETTRPCGNVNRAGRVRSVRAIAQGHERGTFMRRRLAGSRSNVRELVYFWPARVNS